MLLIVVAGIYGLVLTIGMGYVVTWLGRGGQFFLSAVDVSWHMDVDPAFSVVPVEIEVVVEGSFPINGDFVLLLEGVDEMVCVGFGELFDSKVINT